MTITAHDFAKQEAHFSVTGRKEHILAGLDKLRAAIVNDDMDISHVVVTSELSPENVVLTKLTLTLVEGA